MAKYLVVGCIAQRNLVKVVLLHKLVEEIRTQHNRLRDVHLYARKAVKLWMPLDDVVEKGQSAAFSAQRAVANACEVGIAVELHAVEHGHHADIPHVAIAHNGIENNLSVCVNIL